MFATPTSYSLTPAKNNFARIPERASSIIRDVKRRSLRSHRSKTLPEKRLSGTFLPITEDDNNIIQCTPTKRDNLECFSDSNTLTKNHNDSFNNYHTGRRKHLRLTPMIVRKFSFQAPSPTHLDFDTVTLSDNESDNKENDLKVISTVEKRRSNSIRRRCSSYFTPLSKRSVTARMSSSVKNLDRSETEKKLSEITGGGRLIPLKQGYMYKKCGASRLYKRKYVTLCSDSIMTYYPSFQAYIDNVDGKEIQLGRVTVKIPGKKPAGLKTSSEGSTSGDECDKEDLTLELCLEPDEDTCEKGSHSQQLKRKRLSNQSESSANELVLVSLDSTQWQFQLCSQEEVVEWEKAIQSEILNSLCKKEVINMDHVRHNIPGNTHCADCGKENPDWASINLGILVCIECSGIHRNLGSHISKVRSLSLDSWSSFNIKTLETIGNMKANLYWERNMLGGTKPTAKSSREEKGKFIKSKYLLKAFCTFDYKDPCEEELGTLI